MATKTGNAAFIVMTDLFSLLFATMLGLNQLKSIEAKEKTLPSMRLTNSSMQQEHGQSAQATTLPLSLKKLGDHQIVYFLENKEIPRSQLVAEIKKKHGTVIVMRADHDIEMTFDTLTRLYADMAAAGVKQYSYAVKGES